MSVEFLRSFVSTNFSLIVWIAGAIAGAVIVEIIRFLFRWAGQPRLRFQIGTETPFVIYALDATWIRVRVHNRGWRNAESCRVYLTDIFRKGATEPTLKEDAMILQASSGGDAGAFQPLSVSRGFGRFFDIAFFDCEKLLTVTSLQFKDRTNVVERLPPGTYEFRIVAAGTNFNPVRRGVKVQFDGASAPIVSLFRLGPVFSICRAVRGAIRKWGPLRRYRQS
jgi:hypothetical protein